MASPPQIDPSGGAREPATREAVEAPQGAGIQGSAGGPAGAPEAALSRQWRLSLAVFAACSAVLLWLFRHEIGAAVKVWSTSPTFGHGYFIFPISAFLLYRQRHRLAALTPKAAPLALVPILGLTVLWILGELANLMVVRQFAFVGLWQMLFLLVLGWQVTRASLFPLAYLFLAVPLGSEIIPLLQNITAEIVVYLLRLTGMPVFMDGFYIQIPSGNFLVAEACSGLRFLIVCIALGILIAHLFLKSWIKRAFFIALCLVVPVIANGLRAYGIIMLAHLSDYRLAAGVDHIVYGFVFLSVIILILIALTAWLRDRDDALSALPADPAQRQAALNAAGVGRGNRRLLGQGLAGMAALAMVLSAQAWTATAKAPPTGRTAELRAPLAVAPWVPESAEDSDWRPEFHGTDATLRQVYRRGDAAVELNIGYYSFQREGAEAAGGANRLAPSGSGWQTLEHRPTEIIINGASQPIIRSVVRRGGQSYLVWYWYRIGGERTNSRIIGKLLEMKSMALGGERGAAFVAVAARILGDAAEAEAALQDFLDQGVQGTENLVLLKESPSPAGAAMLGPASPDQGESAKSEP